MTDKLDSIDGIVRPSAVVSFLYPRPAGRSVGGILRWWESRRLPYNLVVGASGALTLATAAIVGSLPPHAPGFRFFWVPVAVYAVMANLCYTFGSVVELVVHRLWGRDVLPVGPALWRMGLTFSVGLTLGLPLILITVSWVLRVLGVIV